MGASYIIRINFTRCCGEKVTCKQDGKALAVRLPAPVKVILSLMALEVLAVLAIAVLMVVSAAHTPGESVTSAILLAVAFVLIAGALAVAMAGMRKGRLFSRALTLIWQVFGVIIGTQTALGGQPGIGIPVVVVSGAVLLLLFSTPVMNHLRINSNLPPLGQDR